MSKKSKRATKKSPTSKPQLTEEDKIRRHEFVIVCVNSLTTLVKTFMVVGCAVACAYFIFTVPVVETAGKTTTITVTQKFLAAIDAHVYIAWGTAAAATALYWNERKQKLKERQEKDARLRRYEKEIDPNIESSGMTVDGSKTLRNDNV